MTEDDSKRRVAAAEAHVKSLNEMVTAQAEEVNDYRRRMMLHVSSTHSNSDPLHGREQVCVGGEAESTHAVTASPFPHSFFFSLCLSLPLSLSLPLFLSLSPPPPPPPSLLPPSLCLW